jgi:hypothetical protein
MPGKEKFRNHEITAAGRGKIMSLEFLEKSTVERRYSSVGIIIKAKTINRRG